MLEIYQNQNVNTQYIIKITTSFNEAPNSNEYLCLLSNIKKYPHDNIAKLYHFETDLCKKIK
jgi:hypothetical protein